MDLMAYKKFYDRQAAFYQRHAWAKRTLIVMNYALTAFVFIAYLALLVLRAVHKEWYALALGVALPVGCFCAVFLLRELFKRKRPYDPSGAGIQPLFQKLHGSDKSFPSRHTAMAFVIGGVWLPFCLPVGVSVGVAGLLLGYIRFTAGLHYPTDILGGIFVGGLFGCLIFAF